MRVKRAISAILKSKSGASLVFVLGIAMILLAIGASVLTSATASRGSYIRQEEHNRAMLLSDSVHRNILHSLQDPNAPGLLARQIAEIVRDHYYENGDDGLVIELSINVTDDVIIKLSFPVIMVYDVEDARPFEPEILVNEEEGILEPQDSIPREPSFARIRATMDVTVEVESNRAIKTQATYEFRGGELLDNWPYNDTANPTTQVELESLKMIFTSYGKWELISYEFVDP